MTLLDGALDHIFGLFHHNDMPSSPETPISQRTSETRSETVDVFERFKSYLDQKVETLTSGFVSQATNGTQKLERAAEAGKLKFQGNKDQFLFNSELQLTLADEAVQFLGCAGRRESRREELRNSSRHRQKIIKLADKSEAGWLAVKEY